MVIEKTNVSLCVNLFSQSLTVPLNNCPVPLAVFSLRQEQERKAWRAARAGQSCHTQRLLSGCYVSIEGVRT